MRNSGGGSHCNVNELEGILQKEPVDVVALKRVLNGCAHDPSARNVVKRAFKKAVSEMETFFESQPQKRLDWAAVVASYLVVLNLKTNQVRKVLDLARDIHIDFKNEKLEENRERILSKLARMRFLLAYSVGKADRRDKDALEALHTAIDPLLLKVSTNPSKERFEFVYDFIQAIIAYHRFFGGRE